MAKKKEKNAKFKWRHLWFKFKPWWCILSRLIFRPSEILLDRILIDVEGLLLGQKANPECSETKNDKLKKFNDVGGDEKSMLNL